MRRILEKFSLFVFKIYGNLSKVELEFLLIFLWIRNSLFSGRGFIHGRSVTNLILEGLAICFWFYFNIREQVFINLCKDNKYVVIFKMEINDENNLYYNIKIQIYKMF